MRARTARQTPGSSPISPLQTHQPGGLVPPITVISSELPPSGAGVSADVATVFAVGTAGEGPPAGGAPFVLCQSLGDFDNAFGARATDNSVLRDELDEFFSDQGQQAYIARVTDPTAVTATLTLLDSGGHPTVKVSALTPGAEGNSIQIAVTATAVEVEDSSGDLL